MASPNYRVRVRAFADTTTYGKGEVIAEFENAKNIGWAYYANDVPEAFFTLNQDDPKAELLRPYLNGECHIEILRNASLVWSGWPLETDENDEDFIVYAYGYASALYWLHTDWEQSWTDVQLNTIFSDVMTRATTGLSDSLLGWISAGTVQAPPTTSDGSTAIVLPEYKAYWKRILFVIREITALAESDTTNRVFWEITRNGEYNFLKDKGSDLTTVKWEYPTTIQAYSRLRVPAHRRNVILAAGSSPRDVVLKTTQEYAPDRSSNGRREESIYLTWVRGQTALERTAKLRLKRARRTEHYLRLRMKRNSVVPYPVPASDYSLMDTVPVKIVNGITNIDDQHLIIGQEVIVANGEETVYPLLQQKPI